MLLKKIQQLSSKVDELQQQMKIYNQHAVDRNGNPFRSVFRENDDNRAQQDGRNDQTRNEEERYDSEIRRRDKERPEETVLDQVEPLLDQEVEVLHENRWISGKIQKILSSGDFDVRISKEKIIAASKHQLRYPSMGSKNKEPVNQHVQRCRNYLPKFLQTEVEVIDKELWYKANVLSNEGWDTGFVTVQFKNKDKEEIVEIGRVRPVAPRMGKKEIPTVNQDVEVFLDNCWITGKVQNILSGERYEILTTTKVTVIASKSDLRYPSTWSNNKWNKKPVDQLAFLDFAPIFDRKSNVSSLEGSLTKEKVSKKRKKETGINSTGFTDNKRKEEIQVKNAEEKQKDEKNLAQRRSSRIKRG